LDRLFNASPKILLRLPDVKPPIVGVSEQSAVVFRQATTCDGRQRRQQLSDVLMNDLKYPERQTHSPETLTELSHKNCFSEFMRRKQQSFRGYRECESVQSIS
jgi:hypothetical protein